MTTTRASRQTRLPFRLRKRTLHGPLLSKPTAAIVTASPANPPKKKRKRRLTVAQQQQLQQDKERRQQRAAEREKEQRERHRLRVEEEERQQLAVSEQRRCIEQALDLERLDEVLLQMIDEGLGVEDSDVEEETELRQQAGDDGEERQAEEQAQPASPLPALLLPSPTSSSASSIASEDSSSSVAVSPVSEPADSDDESLLHRITRLSSSSTSSRSYRSAGTAGTGAFELDFDLELDWPRVLQRDLFYKVAYTPLLPATAFALPSEYDADRKLHCGDTEPSFTLIERNEWKRKKPAVKRNKQDREDEQDSVTRCNCHLRQPDAAAADQPQQTDEKAEAETKGEVDGTVYHCGDGCLNATLFVECDDDNCALTSVHASSLCKNRAFTRHSSGGMRAPVEKCWYDVKGWGLRATADVEAGVFIIEYLGEVINNKECKRRIDKEDKRAERSKKRALAVDQQSKKDDSDKQKSKKRKTAKAQTATAAQSSSTDKKEQRSEEADDVQRSNYYFMAVVDDVILDASSKGSIARFINHSCDANCVIQKWTVGDELRIGIFTQRRIRQGEELTIDYKYDRIGLHYQPCYCGSHNCAQWIGAKRNNGPLDGKQRVKLSKQAKKRADAAARARAEQNADEVCGGCGVGGELVLCDVKLPTGHYCPRAHHKECAGLASLEGEIMCAWHFCDRVGPAVCKKRATVYCVCCSSSRCRECQAADEGWAVPWRESQLCLQRVMRLDTRDWLSAQVEGRDDMWVVCAECQEQPRVLTREELAIWRAIQGQARLDDSGNEDSNETDEAMRVEVVDQQREGEQKDEENEVEQATTVDEEKPRAVPVLLISSLTHAG